MNFFVLPNTKEDILKKNCNQAVLGHRWLPLVGNKKYDGSQWCPRTALFPTFFRISSFVFSRTKTFIQVWNNLRVSKWQNFNLWVNYPFKLVTRSPCPSLAYLVRTLVRRCKWFWPARGVHCPDEWRSGKQEQNKHQAAPHAHSHPCCENVC